MRWKIFVVITVVFALLWGTRSAYSLAYLGLVLFFMLQIWQNKAAEKLRIRRISTELNFFPGDQGQTVFRIENPTVLPFAWLSIQDRLPYNLFTGLQGPKTVFSLSARSTKEFALSLTAKERGIYRLGPLDIFVGDFFGIHTQRFQVDDRATVVVYPTLKPLSDLSLSSYISFGNLKARQKMNPDPTRLAGVRPYQGGDPLRTIHWPATAKMQSLQVKEFEHTVTATSMVYLNLYEPDYKHSSFKVKSELAVTLAASLVSHLLNLGESCGLLTNANLAEHCPGEEAMQLNEGIIFVPPRYGVGHLSEVLTILAGVQSQKDLSFMEFINQPRQKPEFGSTLLWVVPQDTVEMVEQAKIWVARGYRVQVFVVGDVLHPGLFQESGNSALQFFATF